MGISPVHQLCTSSKWPSAIERSGRQARMRRARRRAVVGDVDVIKNVLGTSFGPLAPEPSAAHINRESGHM